MALAGAANVGRGFAWLALLAVLGACSLSGVGGTPPPKPSGSSPAAATPGGTPSSVATCTEAIPKGDNLVLGTLTGSPTVVLRDISNLDSPRTICTFAGSISPRFISASVIAYAQQGADPGSPGEIVRLDLASGKATVVASWENGDSGSGTFGWSPDGKSLSYVLINNLGTSWHLVSGGRERVLASIEPRYKRQFPPSAQDDDLWVGFSPDGQDVAMIDTFTYCGCTGNSAPLQVRRVSDGVLLDSVQQGTMGVWESVPSQLLFRDAFAIFRWASNRGIAQLQSGALATGLYNWTNPHASPDGRWIAYTIYDSFGPPAINYSAVAGWPHVALYDVKGNSPGPAPAAFGGTTAGPFSRSGAYFLNKNLLWYQEEAPSASGPTQSQPTGKAFLYDLAAATESLSRITRVFDAWPRATAPVGG